MHTTHGPGQWSWKDDKKLYKRFLGCHLSQGWGNCKSKEFLKRWILDFSTEHSICEEIGQYLQNLEEKNMAQE